jgi:hypothetical protein
MSPPCRQDIGSSYVSTLSARGEDKTTTYVLSTRWRQNYYLCLDDKVETKLLHNICLINKVETNLLPMSHRQGGDKTTNYVLSTRWIQNYYLCLADKVETKLLPMSRRQGGYKTAR